MLRHSEGDPVRGKEDLLKTGQVGVIISIILYVNVIFIASHKWGIPSVQLYCSDALSPN